MKINTDDLDRAKTILLKDFDMIILGIDISLPDSQIKEELMQWISKYRDFKNIPLNCGLLILTDFS